MKGIVKNILIGVSLVASVSAIASAPAQATTPAFTFNNPIQIRTYTGTSTGSFIAGDASNGISAATTALTSSNPGANVELWTSNETPDGYASFSTKLGGANVTVSNITSADWKDSNLSSNWLDGFLSAYSTRGIGVDQSNNVTLNGNTFKLGTTTITKSYLLSALTTFGLPSADDPNIGNFGYNDSTGTLSFDLIGHKDLKPRLAAGQYSTGNAAWDGLLKLAARSITVPLQASEIAKVTVGNGANAKTYYAYNFNATDTGITASDDHSSYSGKYSWSQKILPGTFNTSKSVPEPSNLLGIAGIAGLIVAQRKMKKYKLV